MKNLQALYDSENLYARSLETSRMPDFVTSNRNIQNTSINRQTLKRGFQFVFIYVIGNLSKSLSNSQTFFSITEPQIGLFSKLKIQIYMLSPSPLLDAEIHELRYFKLLDGYFQNREVME